MDDYASWSERRRELRVPLRGTAVFRDGVVRRATIQNLSRRGALLSIAGRPEDGDIELKLGTHSGWVSARMVRIERGPRRMHVAVVFDRVDAALQAAIDAAIEHAVRAAQQRPILVVDERVERRSDLVTRLAARGMSPLAPKTALEAIDMLARTQLHVSACLLSSRFAGYSASELQTMLGDSFPWVHTALISNDVDDTVDRAAMLWSATDVARLARAIA